MAQKQEAMRQIEISVENREAVIKEYAPMTKYVANRIAMRLPPHIEVDDLISVGVLGLIDAIDKYDSTRGAKFKTYAEFRVRGAILDELRSMDWVPRSVRQKSTAILLVLFSFIGMGILSSCSQHSIVHDQNTALSNDHINSFSITPLHDHVGFPDLPMIQILISNGANVNQKDDYNNTALHIASLHGYNKIID